MLFLVYLAILFLFVVEPEPVGCSSDLECSSNQACRDRSCINPCTNDKPCSPSAICSVSNHKATCKCPPGFDGDAYRQCNKSKSLLDIDNVAIWQILRKLNGEK